MKGNNITGNRNYTIAMTEATASQTDWQAHLILLQ